MYAKRENYNTITSSISLKSSKRLFENEVLKIMIQSQSKVFASEGSKSLQLSDNKPVHVQRKMPKHKL